MSETDADETGERRGQPVFVYFYKPPDPAENTRVGGSVAAFGLFGIVDGPTVLTQRP